MNKLIMIMVFTTALEAMVSKEQGPYFDFNFFPFPLLRKPKLLFFSPSSS